jgi:YrbI family 3-deoxy-D-manno-octulosonate 8-phosphate phosphatase
MTDNRVLVHQSGDEAVWCHRGDGWGVARLREAGFEVLVLSMEANQVVSARCRKLTVEAVQGCDDKLTALRALARERGFTPPQIAYVGNDVNDLPCMGWVDWPIAVADAVPEVQAIARWVTHQPGGHGAVREVAERLLSARFGRDRAVERARDSIWHSIKIRQAIAGSEELLGRIVRAARVMAEVVTAGKRLFVLGSGDSPADARLLAAQLCRDGRAARAVTALVFDGDATLARQLDAQAHAGDLLVGITRGSRSAEIRQAMQLARRLGLRTLALTDTNDGAIEVAVDEWIRVPAADGPLFQEACLSIGHVLGGQVERALSGDDAADAVRG